MVAELNGLGGWIWQLKQCDGGNFQKTVERCKKIGVKWLAIKMGDSDAYPFFTTQKIQELKQICNDQGMNLCGWNYSLPSTTSRQVAQITELINRGVEGWIIDAETEWEFQSGNDQLAEQFLSNLRNHIGTNVALAHAPFAMIDYHIKFPYTAFGKYCNYVMPQCYNSQFDWTMDYSIKLMDGFWDKYFNLHPEISRSSYCPIMASYGNEYSGVKGPLTANDIKLFIETYKNKSNFSFYSVDAANRLFWTTMNTIENNKTISSTSSTSVSVANTIIQNSPVVSDSTNTTQPENSSSSQPLPPVNEKLSFLEKILQFISNLIEKYLINFKK